MQCKRASTTPGYLTVGQTKTQRYEFLKEIYNDTKIHLKLHILNYLIQICAYHTNPSNTLFFFFLWQ